MAMACALCASCMDGDWDEPSNETSPYGNSSITESNVISIAELKTKYYSVINSSTDMNKVIDEDIQIKARVTGNDIQGNIYQQVSIQDETGAIIVGISKGGLNGELAIGQEILINLKGLYIGAYRKQGQIGAPYNSGIGRMAYYTWEAHYKAIGTPDATKIQPIEFSESMDKAENCAKLMTFKGVTIDQSGTKVYAPDDGTMTTSANCVNRNLNGKSSVVLRTSTYADFAGDALPTGKVNITGIFTRFNNVWQILMRSTDDIENAE